MPVVSRHRWDLAGPALVPRWSLVALLGLLRNVEDRPMDDLTCWRTTAEFDSRAGAPVGNALYDACNEVERLRARLTEMENALTWQTSCTSCAKTLDASITEYERAEKATAAGQRVRVLGNELVRVGRPLVADIARRFLAALDHPTDTTVCPHGKPTSTDRPAITTTGVTLCACCGDSFNGRVSGSDRCKTCRKAPTDTTGETETL